MEQTGPGGRNLTQVGKVQSSQNVAAAGDFKADIQHYYLLLALQ